MDGPWITPVEIARLAGVGRAAVSNWRRRYDDFPQPVGGTATSPRFALVDVENWLRRHGRLTAPPVEERAWQQVRGLVADRDPFAAVRRAGELLVAAGSPDGDPDDLRTGGRGDPAREPGSALATMVARYGSGRAFELLLDRLHETTRLPRVPEPVATLMAGLLPPDPDLIYDPACGTGGLLVAALARFPEAEIRGDESDPAQLDLARLRVAAHRRGRAEFRRGGVREGAHPPLAADAVLTAPLYADRGWTLDDPTYDPRWQYGLPPRTEPELAWIQHALANLRPGGRAVLLLPPAVAARTSGRRVRAELLRRGALRALIGLPPGVAPPYNLGLHLWLLRRPAADDRADRVLIADLAVDPALREAPASPPDRDHPTAVDWAARADELLEGLAAVGRGEQPAAGTGAQAVRVMDLLDDTVDLTPRRRLRADPERVDPAAAADLRDRLDRHLRRLRQLLPLVEPATPSRTLPTISVRELARLGALTVSTTGAVRDRVSADRNQPGGRPVWRARDVLAGDGPRGHLPDQHLPRSAVRLAVGDVVAPAIGHELLARVVTEAEAGALPGPDVYLLRPDPVRLDPWFLAGFLRSAANTRQAGSLVSVRRYDVRRAEVPRLPITDQRRYGRLFHQLTEFDRLRRGVAADGEALLRILADGLATGALAAPTESAAADPAPPVTG